MRSRTRTAVLSVLALVLLAVSGLAAGAAAYTWARNDAAERDAATVRIDGVAHDCGPLRALRVSIVSEGPGDARFAVDGVEVPSRRVVVDGDRVETSALLPAPARTPRCDDGVAHRYDVFTGDPQRCRWSVSGQQTPEEARGRQGTLRLSGIGCTLTLQ